MRKFILLSVTALVLSLTACSGSGEKDTESGTEKQIEEKEPSGEGDEDLVISPDTEELEPAKEKTLEIDETDETWFTEDGDVDFINE